MVLDFSNVKSVDETTRLLLCILSLLIESEGIVALEELQGLSYLFCSSFLQ